MPLASAAAVKELVAILQLPMKMVLLRLLLQRGNSLIIASVQDMGARLVKLPSVT